MSTWLPIWPIKRTEMNEIALANRAADWRRLKTLVLDSVSSPITKRVYNLGLDEFFAWYGSEPRPGFTKATVSAWRVALEARGLGSVSINVRITAVRKLAVEAADNGLLAPELAAGIARIKGAKSKGVRVGNWLSIRQAQTLLNAPDVTTKKGLRDRAMLGHPAGTARACANTSRSLPRAGSAAGPNCSRLMRGVPPAGPETSKAVLAFRTRAAHAKLGYTSSRKAQGLPYRPIC